MQIVQPEVKGIVLRTDAARNPGRHTYRRARKSRRQSDKLDSSHQKQSWYRPQTFQHFVEMEHSQILFNFFFVGVMYSYSDIAVTKN